MEFTFVHRVEQKTTKFRLDFNENYAQPFLLLFHFYIQVCKNYKKTTIIILKRIFFNRPVFFAFVKNGLDSAFVRSKMKINDSKRRKG
jgi:hypothetical protein